MCFGGLGRGMILKSLLPGTMIAPISSFSPRTLAEADESVWDLQLVADSAQETLGLHDRATSQLPLPLHLCPLQPPFLSLCYASLTNGFFFQLCTFFITIICIFIITSVPLTAFRYEQPMNLRARLCHDKNIVVYILCQSII